jgi:hypothetical protein
VFAGRARFRQLLQGFPLLLPEERLVGIGFLAMSAMVSWGQGRAAAKKIGIMEERGNIAAAPRKRGIMEERGISRSKEEAVCRVVVTTIPVT